MIAEIRAAIAEFDRRALVAPDFDSRLEAEQLREQIREIVDEHD